MTDFKKIAGCHCYYSKKYYESEFIDKLLSVPADHEESEYLDVYLEVDVIEKFKEMQYEIDILEMTLHTSDVLRENLYKVVKYYESEIDELVEALDNAITHGKWDVYQDMVDSYNRGMKLIKKHKKG